MSLLGVAGSATAAGVTGWLSPVLIGLSAVLLGRSFWMLYVQKRGSRTAKIVTWSSLAFIVCFWTWQLVLK
ncbi:MAG TPA: hypothetical protein VGY66_23135 [Gemmataceae bacterium]|nr:hypothetical protein [Gemmataceae bacterium]